MLIITLMAEITFVFNKKLGLLANALTNYNVDVALTLLAENCFRIFASNYVIYVKRDLLHKLKILMLD